MLKTIDNDYKKCCLAKSTICFCVFFVDSLVLDFWFLTPLLQHENIQIHDMNKVQIILYQTTSLSPCTKLSFSTQLFLQKIDINPVPWKSPYQSDYAINTKNFFNV